MCQEIANAVVTRFQTSDIPNSEEIFNTEITVSGPYCLGDTALHNLDPSFFESIGQHRIEPDDLRLPNSTMRPNTHVWEFKKPQIQVVLYVIVTTPPGSRLREHIPELDAYVERDSEPYLK